MTSANPNMARSDRRHARTTIVYRLTQAVALALLFFVLAILGSIPSLGGWGG